MDAQANASDPQRDVRGLFVLRPGASAADAVYEAIAAAIEQGLIASGERLSEQGLASLFAVSRTPVREAITRLVAHHMLERSDRGELVVRDISPTEIVDVYVVRQALEALAARLAARAATAVDIARLHTLIDLSEASLEEADRARTANLQVSFHEGLAEASHSPTLVRSLGDLNRVVRRFQANSSPAMGSAPEEYTARVRRSIGEHRELLSAFERGDGEAAAELSRRHSEHALKLRIELMARTRVPRPR